MRDAGFYACVSLGMLVLAVVCAVLGSFIPAALLLTLACLSAWATTK